MQQLKLPLLVSANLKPADGFRSSKGHASTRCSVDDTSNQPMSAERAMLELLAKSKDVAAVVSSWKMRVDVRAVWYFKIFKACRFWQVLKTDIYIYYLPSGFLKKYDKCWLQAAKFFTLKKIRCRSPARLLGWCCTIVLILWKGCWPQSNDHPYGDDWLAEIVQDDIQKKGKVEMWWWSRKVVNGTCPRESCASIRYLSLPISPIYLFRTTSSGTSSYKSTNEARTKKNNANLSVITAISVVSKSARDDLVLMGWNPALVDIPRHPNTCGLKVFL